METTAEGEYVEARVKSNAEERAAVVRRHVLVPLHRTPFGYDCGERPIFRITQKASLTLPNKHSLN